MDGGGFAEREGARQQTSAVSANPFIAQRNTVAPAGAMQHRRSALRSVLDAPFVLQLRNIEAQQRW